MKLLFHHMLTDRPQVANQHVQMRHIKFLTITFSLIAQNHFLSAIKEQIMWLEELFALNLVCHFCKNDATNTKQLLHLFL